MNSKPALKSTVTISRDITRRDIDGIEFTIPAGTRVLVTDTMDRAGYRKADRIGIRVPGTTGLSIGVSLADIR